MIKIDVVLDASFGDSGKGKISHFLLGKNKYTHALRGSGGSNAGHTIYHNGKKFVTHLLPAGIFYGIKSIIGPGCVVNVKKFFEEINLLKTNGVSTKGLIKIAKNAHIVTDEHIASESNEKEIGTTKQGIGPAYTAKYARKGILAESIPELKEYMIDIYEEFYSGHDDKIILYEGSQGFFLDIDFGDYPYVTSSHCGIGGVLLNGFNHTHIRDVYSVAKVYETYVGAKQFEDKTNPIFAKIREIGGEYGATTGRPRQCNWLNLDNLVKAVKMSGANKVILNKLDVLKQLGEWKLYKNNMLLNFSSEEEFCDYIIKEFWKLHTCTVTFSSSPHSL